MTPTLRMGAPPSLAAADFAALHAICFTETPPPWSAAAFESALTDKNTQSISALAPDGALIGFAFGLRAGDDIELLTLCVAPAARRCGVADALLTELAEGGARDGFSRFTLEVAENNAAACALYRRFGFEPIARRKRYYRQPSGPAIDALILAKNLIEPK